MPFSPFSSFWMAGYECADQLNKYGDRVDLLTASGHLAQLESDYQLLGKFNIKTVREGIRWSVVEYAPYCYDWESVSLMIKAGLKYGIQQQWDLCHFGFPDDLTPLHPHFSKRFEALCIAFIRHYRSIDPSASILITPINEVSFLSWLGGEVAGTSPYCVRQGWEVKYQLMRAYINGVAAIRATDTNVIIISTEPLVHIVPDENAAIMEQLAAATERELQFQALDILCGYACPELGGRPDYVDVIGLNFYHGNQWMYGTTTALAWAEHDRHADWMPLSDLIAEVYRRYHKPVALTETSHRGEDRGLWMQYIGAECKKVVEKGIPLLGICIYPIIDRPDWDDRNFWHHSGLWDVADLNRDSSQRILYQPYAHALIKSQQLLDYKEKTPVALQLL